jgi:predicted acylesterase/phospholipase RssA
VTAGVRGAISHPGLALALGGVGWTALACIPLLSWLEANHVQPGLIVTTGFATLPAALWALGMPALEIIATLKAQLPNRVFRRRNIIPYLTLLGCPLPNRGLGQALWRSGPLKAACQRVFGDARLDTSPVPLRVLLVDCSTGAFFGATQGKLAALAYASTALAPALPPLHIDGRWLGDASVYHATPVTELLLEPGIRHVAATTCGFPPPDHYTSLPDQQLTLQMTLQKAGLKTGSLLALHLLDGEFVVIAPRLPRPADPFDCAIVPDVVEAAKQEFGKLETRAALLLQDATS